MSRRMAINVGSGFFLFACILILSNLSAGAATAAPEPVSPEAQKTAVSSAVTWLMQTSQNPDGGFGVDFGTGQPQSSASTTLDAMLAVAASGENPAAIYPGRQASATDYLLANTDALLNYASFSGGGAGKTILALVAANQNPRDFGGTDWVAFLASQLSPTGTYNTLDAYNQSLAVMALLAVNEPLPAAAVNWLKDAQDADGSWDDGFGTNSCSDATAMAIMAMLAADVPVSDPVIVDALEFLADTQLASGGWEYGPGYGENANSNALVVQALSAAGEDFYSGAGVWAVDGRSPLAILLDWQSESGAFVADFGQGPADNLFATLQAIPGATGKPFPLAGRYEANQRALLCLAELQDESSGGWEQFGGFGVNAAGTSRAIEAIRAAGGDPQAAQWMPGTVSAVDALAAQTPDYLAGGRGGRAGIVSQAVVAAGTPFTPEDFAGVNLPEAIAGHLAPAGDYADTAFGYSSQAEAMLGLLAAGAPVADTAVALLLNAANAGDWGSPDGNGIVLNVLGRLGIGFPAAITQLRQTQQEDAGWGYGLPADPSATSEIVQGLVQSGQNPFASAWSLVIDGRLTNAADTIMNQQLPNGCWPNRYAAGDDPFGTTDAMVMLAQQGSWQSGQIMLPVIVGP